MKNTPSTKDLLYFFLLIGLIKVAVILQDHQQTTIFSPPQHSLEIASIETPILAPQPVAETIALRSPESSTDNTPVPEFIPAPEPKTVVHMQPFDADEIKENVLKQIDMAQQHIDVIMSIVHPTSINAAQLASLKQRLRHLRKQYQKIAPADSLESASASLIAAKTQSIEKDILNTIHKIGAIVYEIAHIQEPYLADASITGALALNHEKINALIAA